MIFKQSISYRLVCIIWFCPDRDHRKRVIKVLTASSLLFFFWTRYNASTGERRSREKRGMTDIFFAIYWCSCVSIFFYLQYYSIIIRF